MAPAIPLHRVRIGLRARQCADLGDDGFPLTTPPAQPDKGDDAIRRYPIGLRMRSKRAAQYFASNTGIVTPPRLDSSRRILHARVRL